MNRSIIGHAVLARLPSSSNETRLATSTSPRPRQNGGDAGFECFQSSVIYRSRHPLSSLKRRGSSSATAFADNSYPRKVSRSLRSEEHTLNSSHVAISYAVFCLNK